MLVFVIFYLLPALAIVAFIAACIRIEEFASFVLVDNYSMIFVLAICSVVPGLNTFVAASLLVHIACVSMFNPPRSLKIKRKSHQ